MADGILNPLITGAISATLYFRFAMNNERLYMYINVGFLPIAINNPLIWLLMVHHIVG